MKGEPAKPVVVPPRPTPGRRRRRDRGRGARAQTRRGQRGRCRRAGGDRRGSAAAQGGAQRRERGHRRGRGRRAGARAQGWDGERQRRPRHARPPPRRPLPRRPGPDGVAAHHQRAGGRGGAHEGEVLGRTPIACTSGGNTYELMLIKQGYVPATAASPSREPARRDRKSRGRAEKEPHARGPPERVPHSSMSSVRAALLRLVLGGAWRSAAAPRRCGPRRPGRRSNPRRRRRQPSPWLRWRPPLRWRRCPAWSAVRTPARSPRGRRRARKARARLASMDEVARTISFPSIEMLIEDADRRAAPSRAGARPRVRAATAGTARALRRARWPPARIPYRDRDRHDGQGVPRRVGRDAAALRAVRAARLQAGRRAAGR